MLRGGSADSASGDITSFDLSTLAAHDVAPKLGLYALAAALSLDIDPVAIETAFAEPVKGNQRLRQAG